jgi:conjugal transfer/entry exclusion protein
MGKETDKTEGTGEANTQINELQNEIKMGKTRIEELEGQLEKNQKSLDEAQGVIDDMQKSIDKKASEKPSGSGRPTVKVGGKEYQIRVAKSVRFKGKDVTAKDIQENKDLAASMVKIGAGCLVEVSK